jgi:tRNA A-37 threonylcarbamoyl transferase component Bud32
MTIERLRASLADRYTIERELGAGGMATVYLAEDLKHHRKVALKVLRPELAASLGHERFLREITTTANLRHPHILPLFDSGRAVGTEGEAFLYYVMPFVEGETLRDRLDREKQLPLDDALQITGEVADAMSYAHGRGVIHRDIKPENILLEGGHAVVADFGIARAVTAAGAQSLTQTGMAIGTPAYMSPEQAGGEPDIDGRSDLYALGCVTYEMLAGQPPFTGPTVASVVHQHLAANPRPVTQLRAALPAAVADALQRALAKNPVDRFATPTAFAAALRTTTQSRAVRIPRRLGVAALAVLALAAGAVVWRALRGSSSAGLDPDVIAVLPFRVGGDPAIGYLRESMLDLLQARISGATGPRIVEPRTLLAAWRRSVGSGSEDLSEAASRALARNLGAGRLLLGSAVATPTELTLSGALLRTGDGKELARESVAGAPDSVAVLVNRLTAALLIGEAGESRDRSAGLASASLDALQDYLAGRQASRRGDYFVAMDLFGRAFARDSTFVDAAFAMVTTNAWIGTVFASAGWQVVPRVGHLRDRLSARDLSLFLSLPMVGPNYPRPSTHAEVIAQAERAANAALDSPEHWVLLGQMLSHYGAAASRSDWAARSAEALDRAIALDSTFTLAISERLWTALAARDTAAIRQVAGLLQRRVSSGFADDFYLWAAARAQGDSVGAMRWRNRMDGLSRTDVMQKLTKMALHSAALALPLDDARWAVDTLQREAATVPERVGAGLSRLALRFAAGRTDLGDVNIVPGTGPQWAGTVIQQALIEPMYRPMAAATLAQVAAGQYRLQAGGGAIPWPPTQDCFAALYRVAGGDTAGAAAALRRLRAFAATDHPPIARDDWQLIDFRVCPLLLQVLLEGTPTGHVAWPALDRLDSLMREDPRGYMGIANTAPTAFANYAVARLRESQGNIPAALAAIRRREVDYFPAYLWSLPAFLRQEGRLATLAGDTAGAIRAYDAYLTLRTDPDPPFVPQRDSVVAERATLRRSRTP